MGHKKGRNAEQMPRKQDSSKTQRTAHTAWWKKPFVWIGTLVLAALAASVTAWLQPKITGAIDNLTESGEPVVVNYSLKPATTFHDVALPVHRPLTYTDIEGLNRMAPDDQVRWLESNGGVPLGVRTLTATLKGNRTHLVRITDIRPVSECNEPSRGSLILTAFGRGATAKSIILYIEVGDPSKEVEYFSPETGEREPFFPAKTITLTESEEEYLVMELLPSRGQHCRVQVELTVMDGDREVRQRIPRDGQQISIMSALETDHPTSALYPTTYLGADICKRVVQLPEGMDPSEDVCGPGNVTRLVDGK